MLLAELPRSQGPGIVFPLRLVPMCKGFMNGFVEFIYTGFVSLDCCLEVRRVSRSLKPRPGRLELAADADRRDVQGQACCIIGFNQDT